MQGTLEQRFWTKVEKAGANDCWHWRADTDRHGYGRISTDGTIQLAHRVSWQLAHGERPAGCVCHSCDNPVCVNPAHLWTGSHADNMRDRTVKGRHRNGCIHGHPTTPENRVRNGGSSTRCRTCNNIRNRERKLRQMEPA